MQQFLRNLILISLITVGFNPVLLYAKIDVNEQTKLIEDLNAGKIPQFYPEDQHPQASQIITTILVNYHYRKPLIDNAFSSQVFDAYLEKLDANHNYLIKADLSKMEKFRYLFDNALRNGNVTPAYTIFNKFIHRYIERYQFALKQLEIPMDFSIDETYYYDRAELLWPANTKELNEIWRKRVKNDVLNLKLADKEIDDIKVLLNKRYKASMRRMAQLKSQDVFLSFMDSVAQTVEPHTNYFSPRDAENFDIRMKLSLEGIGAMLQSEDVYTKIVSLVPKGPADKAGEVKADDKIIAVGQEEEPLVDVIGWRLDDVVDLIRGAKGTIVRLEVLPKGSGADSNSKIISITRDTVKLEEQSAKSEIVELKRNGHMERFGVISLPTFYMDFEAYYKGEVDYKSTTRDVRQLLNDFEKEKISGVIIDLRYNGGGALLEAVQLTGLFINKGPVVQQRNFKNEISVSGDSVLGTTYDGPLVVLVNRGSASASEIFAAAIQDYGRGIIVGEQTFGKGTVQSIRSLDQLTSSDKTGMGQLKYTLAKFYRVNGESMQHKGVVPDIIYPSAFNGDDFGESAETNALPWDTISPVDYLPVASIDKLFPKLNIAHIKRISTDKEFRYLIEDIEEYNVRTDDKSISLNFKTRKEKRVSRETKLLERVNRRRIEKGLESIANVDDIDDDDDEQPDARLDETAEILHDYIALLNNSKTAYFKKNSSVEQLEN